MAVYWNPTAVFLSDNYAATALTQLTDPTYRQCLQMQAILNSCDGTLSAIQKYLQTFFPGLVTVVDSAAMVLTYNVSRGVSIDPGIIANFLPKPMGVAIIVNIV